MGRMENSYNVMYACNKEMDKKDGKMIVRKFQGQNRAHRKKGIWIKGNND
jgi:hypothetical protein